MFRLKRNVLFSVLVVAMALVLAACGGNGDGNGDSNGDTANNGNGSTITGPATIQIDMNNLAYHPATVTIPPGTTVRWVNTDNTPHNVKEGTAEEFQAGTQDPDFSSPQVIPMGEFWEYTFDEVGEFDYLCDFGSHYRQGMVGRIIVQEGASVPSNLVI